MAKLYMRQTKRREIALAAATHIHGPQHLTMRPPDFVETDELDAWTAEFQAIDAELEAKDGVDVQPNVPPPPLVAVALTCGLTFFVPLTDLFMDERSKIVKPTAAEGLHLIKGGH